jgi:CheY-like chemotaxis protein
MASWSERAKPAGSAPHRGPGIAPRRGGSRQVLSEGVIRNSDHFVSGAAAAPGARRRRSRRPQLPSLLLSLETATIRLVRGVAHREEIPLDVCENADDALELLGAKSYQALLVDLDMPGTAYVLKALRQRDDKPVAVAMVASGALLGTAFDVGAILAIHKPVVPESVRLGLKAAYAVAARQGRKATRRPVHFPCRLGLPGSRLMPGAVVNVGEGGACVSTERCMVPGTFLTLRFALPGAEPVLDIGAVAVWNDGERRTGLRFQRLHYRHAGRIRNFVLASGRPSGTGSAIASR